MIADGYGMHHYWGGMDLAMGFLGLMPRRYCLCVFLGGQYSRELVGKANGYGLRFVATGG